MDGGTQLVVPHPWGCSSTLGMRLEQSFIQIVANGSSEPILLILCFAANDCPAAKPAAPKAQGLLRWSDALVTARDKSSVMTTSVKRLANIKSVFARPLARSIR